MDFFKTEWLYILGVFFVAVGTYITIRAGNSSADRNHAELKGKLENAEDISFERAKQIDLLVKANSNLSNEIRDMREEQSRSNQLLSEELKEYQDKIVEKDKKIEALEQYIDKSKRGVIKTIGYDGTHYIVSKTGTVTRTNTDENVAFDKLHKLFNNGDSQELLSESLNAINLSKDWYTPYIFKAIALYNLDRRNIDEVNKLLDYVELHTAEDFKYQKVLIEIHNAIGNSTKARELSNKLDPNAIEMQKLNQDLLELMKKKKWFKKE